MFPSDRLNKAFVLAPMSFVADTDYTPPSGASAGGFARPNFGLAKNLEAWGHLQQDGQPGFFPETGTKVVRLWADWNAIQFRGPKFNNPCLQALDSNIAAAKRANLSVILTSRSFPGWVTGYGAPNASGDFLTVPDPGRINSPAIEEWLNREFPDPAQRAAAARAIVAARADQGHPEGTAEPGFGSAKLQLRWPGDIADADASGNGSKNKDRARTDLLAPGQPWNQWITFLANRYHPSRQVDTIAGAPPRVAGATIDVLEVVNEPNLEIWPQVATDLTTQIAPAMTAEMIRQAVTIEKRVNAGLTTPMAPLYFAGPATSDRWRAQDATDDPYDERFTSSYDRFLRRVARDWGLNFAPGSNFIFTHHNYLDIERERRARPLHGRFATSGVNSAAWVLSFMLGNQVRIRVKPTSNRILGFKWKGWPNETKAPKLAITEGGARLRSSVDEEQQRALVRTAFQETREGRYGNGIVLFSNFLTWEDSGTSVTTSHFVDRTVQRGGAPVDVEALPATDEPALSEYRVLQHPVYDTWNNLSETP